MGVMMKRLGLILIYPIILVGLVYTALRYIGCVAVNPDKGWHVALMVDETCNVDANGKVNETISARAAKARNAGTAWGCVLCKILDWIQANHCTDALNDDKKTG
jgi:hypothetical protein